MPSDGPDPSAVFPQQQWAEIAKALSLGRIPSDEKQEICDAIFACDLARIENERAADEAEEKSARSTRRRVDPKAKGRAALSNFVKYTRGLRHALYSVQNYLKNEPLINEAEQLAEQIYKFQESAKRELDKKSRGGRPAQKAKDDLVIRLGVIYERLTGKKPTRTVGGRFWKFAYAIFQAHGITTAGLPNRIEKAVRYAKNQH
jgi:hypothetical protein